MGKDQISIVIYQLEAWNISHQITLNIFPLDNIYNLYHIHEHNLSYPGND